MHAPAAEQVAVPWNGADFSAHVGVSPGSGSVADSVIATGVSSAVPALAGPTTGASFDGTMNSVMVALSAPPRPSLTWAWNVGVPLPFGAGVYVHAPLVEQLTVPCVGWSTENVNGSPSASLATSEKLRAVSSITMKVWS